MTFKKAKNLTLKVLKAVDTTALPPVTLWLNYVLLWLQINLQKHYNIVEFMTKNNDKTKTIITPLFPLYLIF